MYSILSSPLTPGPVQIRLSGPEYGSRGRRIVSTKPPRVYVCESGVPSRLASASASIYVRVPPFEDVAEGEVEEEQ